MKNSYNPLLFIIIIVILGYCITKWINSIYKKIDKKFYNVSEVYPELNKIYSKLDSIKHEINNINENNDSTYWKDWPEKDLYDTSNKSWKIIPFKAFGLEVEENCKKYPQLWEFIQSIPNVKIAILSKLGPGTKLTSHRGWGNHSNHVLRCHFGLDIPQKNKCYIAVADSINNKIQEYEKQYHSQDAWLIFDDSKYHYAENPTEFDRIVLIIDIERPPHIKTGSSTAKDTKELVDIVNSFK
jgi:beta-hydroxylase